MAKNNTFLNKLVKCLWRLYVHKERLKRILVKNILSDCKAAYYWVSALILSACGGGKSIGVDEIKVIGFSSNYVPPKSNYDQPNNIDPNFKILEPSISEAYWIKSLEKTRTSTLVTEQRPQRFISKSLLFSNLL